MQVAPGRHAARAVARAHRASLVRLRAGPGAAHALDDRLKLRDIDGLHHVCGEADIAAAIEIVFHAVAGQSDARVAYFCCLRCFIRS